MQHSDEQHSNASQHASFAHSYKLLVRLAKIKWLQYRASYSLACAEVKLSATALLYCLFALLGAVFIAFSLFIILNIAVGLALYNLLTSIAVTLLILAIGNLILLFSCLVFAKKMTVHIGLSRTSAQLRE